MIESKPDVQFRDEYGRRTHVATGYSLTCDVCDDDLDDGEYAYWTIDSLDDVAAGCGWYRSGGLDFCDYCRTADEAIDYLIALGTIAAAERDELKPACLTENGEPVATTILLSVLPNGTYHRTTLPTRNVRWEFARSAARK